MLLQLKPKCDFIHILGNQYILNMRVQIGVTLRSSKTDK